jgi:hypothetical protein
MLLPWRIVCKDQDGATHIAEDHMGLSDGKKMKMTFHILVKQISSMELQTRAFNKVVDIRNITLDPGNPAVPQFIVQFPQTTTEPSP